jgi:hypothetical protein
VKPQVVAEEDVGGGPAGDGSAVDFTTPEGEEEADFNIPAIFATIHFKGPNRPNGYTAEDIEEMNRLANERLHGNSTE